MDRLLRWIETCPDEWRDISSQAGNGTFLVIGRSAQAYATHPRAVIAPAPTDPATAGDHGVAPELSAGSGVGAPRSTANP